MLTVSDLMSRDVVSVGMDDTLLRAHQTMEEHGIRHLPVVDGGVLVGIISSLDIARHLSPRLGTLAERLEDRESLAMLVNRFMTRQPMTVIPETAIQEAAALLLTRRVSSLPVVDGAHVLVGIVTVSDFVRLMARPDVQVSLRQGKS